MIVHRYAPLLDPLPFFSGNGTVALGYVTGLAPAVSSGKALLSEVLVGAALLTAGGSVAMLSEVSVGSAELSEGGATAELSEVLVGSAKLSEDC